MFNQTLVAHSFSSHRAAATAETRQKILLGAFRVLSRRGYENTTVKDIAEEAGVAQGLVNYHFRSKQGLVLAVLEMCRTEMQLQQDQQDPISNALGGFEHFKMTLRDQREINGLFVQLIGVGLHDSEVGAGILETMRQNRAKIEAIAGDVLDQQGQPSKTAPALAGAVWGSLMGIMIESLVDPDFDAQAAVDALAAMSMAAANHPEYLTMRAQAAAEED
jgi:AcrR family transcriptional regulator